MVQADWTPLQKDLATAGSLLLIGASGVEVWYFMSEELSASLIWDKAIEVENSPEGDRCQSGIKAVTERCTSCSNNTVTALHS